MKAVYRLTNKGSSLKRVFKGRKIRATVLSCRELRMKAKKLEEEFGNPA